MKIDNIYMQIHHLNLKENRIYGIRSVKINIRIYSSSKHTIIGKFNKMFFFNAENRFSLRSL